MLAIPLVLGANGSTQQGGNQGTFGQATDGSTQAIEQGIARYLNGPETDSVVTPGESVEYTVPLKAGQVVIGEARSDAFDPALEIVDADGKAVAANDDRYPGDQRPLLLWRAGTEGSYRVRVRSFRDRSGGKVFVRLKTYETIDLGSGEMVEREIDAGTPFLVRIPMKRGQVKEERADVGGPRGYLPFGLRAVIAPGGLPDIGLSSRLQPAVNALVAPVDGDYYVLHTPFGTPGSRGKVRIGTRELIPVRLSRDGDGVSAKQPTNVATLAELAVRKGEFLRIETPELSLGTRLVLAAPPDFAKYDLAKPETNPFIPRKDPQEPEPEPAFDLLPGRTGDGRAINLRARRDARLWVATNAPGPQNGSFAFRVSPAARELTEGNPHPSKLRIADYDHWTFEAKPGDVMNFDVVASEFREVTVVRDPDLEEIRHVEMGLDQSRDTWRMVVHKPGRYFVTVSALGDGGSGTYSIARRAFSARQFGKESPAKGEISSGEVQVWRFTARPNDPLFIRWKSTNWDYDVAIYDDQGRPTDFQRERLDPNQLIGILTVAEPRTYVIVLTGTGAKATYSIELGGIPKS
jgi:hypothetical protein